MKNCNYKLKFDKELGEHKTQFDNFKKIEDEKDKYYKERMQDLSNKYKYDEKQKRLYKCESEKKELQKKIDDISIIKDKECIEKIKQKDQEHDTFVKSVKSGLVGGKIRNLLETFENKISGGIIGQMKSNFKKNYENELKNFNQLVNNRNNANNVQGRQHGGNPMIMLVTAVIKIVLMTIGTFFFNWWPIMFIISMYCVYVEYKMIKLSGDSIFGLPMVFLLGAYFCPCLWAIARVTMGWTIENGTPRLFNVFSKCSPDGFTLNFHEYYGRDCNSGKCVWTTKSCHGALFGKEELSLDTFMPKT